MKRKWFDEERKKVIENREKTLCVQTRETNNEYTRCRSIAKQIIREKNRMDRNKK